MQSSSNAFSQLQELRATLADLMKEATFSEEILKEAHLPVIMMIRQNAVTVFAVGDQDDYQPLYDAFKKYYLKKSAQWSVKDLAFVYCIPSDVDVPPDFCSRVEVDVYFCRKYVVCLDGALANKLARLPFLPLSPITRGIQTRPPSAQTLLRHRNVKADLAKALVVPLTSGASTILAGCLAGSFGLPEALRSAAGPTTITDSGEDRVQATLKSISIQNFRAYRTKKEFEFGSAVTILYGPNGFGKTSFFDALDFAVTGGVGRLARAPGGISRIAKHLDSQNDITEVVLALERDGKEYVIKRNLTDHNNALVNGKTTARKEVLSLLTGGTAPGAERVDSLVDLFRATHLFSQENQELTQNVASKCELSSELVSRMLAFEDYASGLKKVEEVLKLAGQEHSKATTEIENTQLDIAHDSKELKRLEGLAASDTNPAALDSRFSALNQDISAAGLDISGVSSRDTRILRGMLDTAAAAAATRKIELSRALEQIGTLSTLRSQLEPIQTQLNERQAELQRVQMLEKEASELLGTFSSLLAQLKEQELSFKHRRDWFTWALSVQSEYQQLTSQTQNLSTSLNTLSSQVNQQRANLEQAKATQREAVAYVQKAEAALLNATDKRARIQALKDAAMAWEQAEPRLIGILEAETQFRVSIEEMQRQLIEAQKAEHSQTLMVSRAEQELAEIRSNDSRLKELISELRNHVDGPICQLCGHDHRTKENLLATIDQRMLHSDRIIQLSEAAAKQRSLLQTIANQRGTLSDKIKQAELQLSQTQVLRSHLTLQRANYEASLNSFTLSLSSETLPQIENLNIKMYDDELKAAAELGLAKRSLEAAKITLASAHTACQTIDQQRLAAESAQNGAKQRLNELLSEANRGSVSLASGLQALADAQRAAEEQRDATSSAAQSTNKKVDEQKAVQAAAKKAVDAARVNHEQASHLLTGHQARIHSVQSELVAAGFDSETSQQFLHKQIKIATEREFNAVSLRNRVAELEVAVDTAATSAAFESIKQRILANQTKFEEANLRAQKLMPWIEYFNAIKKLLSTQQAVATDHFITQYGPRTAVIQQRLRPVYGFGEIEVSSKDSTIGIQVKRKGESLKPTDFFSQSQVQTLVLGLFLTACSSQTWSGFSSIMMDDPVTHFDDLNTYALLDLILGLQSSSDGERQFVISTCDEKLLQLARHKFRHLGDAAKFYRFQAIGADGPMVSEISA